MIAASSLTPACAGSRCARGVAIHKPAYAAGRRLLASSARGRTMVASAAIDPDNASILVAGGGGVALEVVRKLKDMGSWVWMLQRTDNRRAEVEAMKAMVVNGDALDKTSLEKAFSQIDDLDAVVSTIGGTTQNPQADSQGNINVIEEAAKRGVKKFILVTSIGTGDSKDAVSEDVYSILQPVLEQKVLAEDRLKELGEEMTFVIIRPGGLKSEPETGNGVLTEDTSVCGSIHRGDVADLVVKALVSEKGDKKVLSAIDKEQVFHNATFQEFSL